MKISTGLNWLRLWSTNRCFEYGNELSYPIKAWKSLHQLSYYKLVKKDSSQTVRNTGEFSRSYTIVLYIGNNYFWSINSVTAVCGEGSAYLSYWHT